MKRIASIAAITVFAITVFVCAGLFVACGGAQEPATAHDADHDSDTASTDSRMDDGSEPKPSGTRLVGLVGEQGPAAPREIPADCSGDGEVCSPPSDFVKYLCRVPNPDVALAMFRKEMPWTRAWVRGSQVEAWYASGQRSRPRQLKYAEEVIVIDSRSGASGGVQVSGAGSFDVYRWDGTCVSLMEGELTFHRPATPDVATIPWKRLHVDTKTVLEQNQRVSHRNVKRRKACKEFGELAVKRCDKARARLSRSIANYVRSGGDLPEPKLVP